MPKIINPNDVYVHMPGLHLEQHRHACRVGGALEGGMIVDVAAGLSVTVAATLHGRVFQMGEMGTSKPAKWEGTRVPEQVRPFFVSAMILTVISFTVLALA